MKTNKKSSEVYFPLGVKGLKIDTKYGRIKKNWQLQSASTKIFWIKNVKNINTIFQIVFVKETKLVWVINTLAQVMKLSLVNHSDKFQVVTLRR